MLLKWPIRVKLLVGLGVIVLVVGILAASGLYTTYSYRDLVKSLSLRVEELPVAAQLARRVGDLRITVSELRGLRAVSFPHSGCEDQSIPLRVRMVRDQFDTQLQIVEQTLERYREQLERKLQAGSSMADNQREWQTMRKTEAALARVHKTNNDEQWMLDEVKVGQLDVELENLQSLVAELPSHLHHKLAGFADEARGQYRVLILGTWATTITAFLLFGLFGRMAWKWVLMPLRIIIHGSRNVAAGHFGYRIRLNTHDEMSELADAMNHMTARFEAIRDDLDRQVRERTKQVIRGEQLASVGFLAAGVAHEINNPLASVAMCAESLQGRVAEVLKRAGAAAGHGSDPDHDVIRDYLQMIQDESFRCKEITGKLLDFSRIGCAEREHAELAGLIQDVVDMLGHLGKYQNRHIVFEPAGPVIAAINVSEIKQVVLNLLTNALDSLDDGGHAKIELWTRDGFAEMTFTDDGCGMQPDVLEHVFVPFYTRRRSGQGTGLGLSITYRIVADHGGDIEARSDGPGQGSAFHVRLPLAQTSKEITHRHQAA